MSPPSRHRLNIYSGKQRLLSSSWLIHHMSVFPEDCYVRGDQRRWGFKAASGGLTWDLSQLRTPVGDQVTSSVRFLPRVSCVQAGSVLLSVGKGAWLSKGVIHVCLDLLCRHAGRFRFHLAFHRFLFFVICERSLASFYDTHTPSPSRNWWRVNSVIRSDPDTRWHVVLYCIVWEAKLPVT